LEEKPHLTTEKLKISYAPDIKIFLILIPLISAFNYYLTYSYVAFDSFTLIRYTVDTVQGLIAWWMVRGIIIFLDQKVPFLENPVKRTVIQLVSTCLIGLGFIVISTELLSRLVYGKPAIDSFYTLDVLIILIWFFVINGIYIGLLLYKQLSKKATSSEKNDGILVSRGKQKRLVCFDNILALSVDAGYVDLITDQGGKYTLDQSLDQWEKKLPKNIFFRINRKCILSRKGIAGFESKENGKLKIQVSDSLSHLELGVSRAKAPKFKRWFWPEA
jgi:hypothetical protein